MTADHPPAVPEPAALPLVLAAELQDHLMTAANDLDRLQRLLTDASETLMGHFYGANQRLNRALHQAAAVPEVDTAGLHEAMGALAGAVTALQFQDMASQLITHTHRRILSCADRLASDLLADDGEGAAVVTEPPPRPNPVTQDEMDAGSVELF